MLGALSTRNFIINAENAANNERGDYDEYEDRETDDDDDEAEEDDEEEDNDEDGDKEDMSRRTAPVQQLLVERPPPLQKQHLAAPPQRSLSPLLLLQKWLKMPPWGTLSSLQPILLALR
jgi:hypothetical protein